MATRSRASRASPKPPSPATYAATLGGTSLPPLHFEPVYIDPIDGHLARTSPLPTVRPMDFFFPFFFSFLFLFHSFSFCFFFSFFFTPQLYLTKSLTLSWILNDYAPFLYPCASHARNPVTVAPVVTFAPCILNGYAPFLFLKVLISSLLSLLKAPFLQPRLVTWRPYPISHLDEWIKFVNIAMPSCGLRYENNMYHLIHLQYWLLK